MLYWSGLPQACGDARGASRHGYTRGTLQTQRPLRVRGAERPQREREAASRPYAQRGRRRVLLGLQQRVDKGRRQQVFVLHVAQRRRLSPGIRARCAGSPAAHILQRARSAFFGRAGEAASRDIRASRNQGNGHRRGTARRRSAHTCAQFDSRAYLRHQRHHGLSHARKQPVVAYERPGRTPDASAPQGR